MKKTLDMPLCKIHGLWQATGIRQRRTFCARRPEHPSTNRAGQDGIDQLVHSETQFLLFLPNCHRKAR